MALLQKHNFGAGPGVLPPVVLNGASTAVKSLDNTGLSILEISHRSKEFEHIIKQTGDLVRLLLDVPESHSILFLQGGASLQFAMVPMNFLQASGKTAVYLDAGHWGHKAIGEARLFGNVEVAGSSADRRYAYIPTAYRIDPSAAYFHCTSNNTIEGTQMFRFPDTHIPVVCDMSSDIFSRPVDVNRFDLIYASAQKNVGPAGLALVIARNSFLDTVQHAVPSMLDYRIYREYGSMYNTPPVFAIYTTMLNLQWLKGMGGVAAITKENQAKAQLLYDEIDHNPIFYGISDEEDRSLMNVTFRLYDAELEQSFLNYAAEKGIVGISGHRTVGGFRASLYNGLPYSSVKVLTNCMRTFAGKFAELTFQPTIKN